MAVRIGPGELRVPIIAASDVADNVSVFALVRPGGAGSFREIAGGHDSAGDDQWSMGLDTSNVPYFFTNNGSQTIRPTGDVAGTEDVWTIIGFTKAGTGGVRRWHIFELGGSWQHIAGDLGGGATTPDSTSGGYLSFGFDNGTAVVGLWKTSLDDTQVEALAAGLTSANWSGHEITPGGAWNFDQTVATDDVADLVGAHDTITGAIDGPLDLNGIDATTILFGSDPPGWDFTAPPPPLSVRFRYSGGATNADPALSIGGAESSSGGVTADGLIGFLLDVLPNFARPAAINGSTIYRGIYVHVNDNGFATPADLVAWFDVLELVDGVALAIGVAVEPSGEDMEALADEVTAPVSVSFSSPTSEGAAIDLETVGGGEGRGLWLRVTLDAGIIGGIHNNWTLNVGVTPL